LKRTATIAVVAGLLLLMGAEAASAEYVVMRNGQRLRVTGYERLGAMMRLHVAGGSVEIPAEEIVAVEPEDYFPAPKKERLDVPFEELIRAAAKRHGVEAQLIASVIAVESNFNPRAVSRKQAQGLMQLMPETAARFAIADAFDPAQNIEAGTRYLKELLEKYGQDLRLALAAFNAGPEKVEQYQGVPPYKETRNYIRKVTQEVEKGKRKISKQRAQSREEETEKRK